MLSIMLLVCRMLAVALASISTLFAADTYPNRPIELVAPNPPGGTVETMARVIADKMANSLGRPVSVSWYRHRQATFPARHCESTERLYSFESAAGTPKRMIYKLSTDIAKILAMADIQ